LNRRSDFVAKIKESWDSLIQLQKTTWEEFKKCEGTHLTTTETFGKLSTRNLYSQRSFEVDERPTFNKTF
jgi:hypothetical protein